MSRGRSPRGHTARCVAWGEDHDSLERLSSRDQGRIFRTLRLLDDNERHPSLQGRQLHGKEADQWAAYATRGLRVTFRRLDEGRKELVAASHYYGD